MSDPTLSTHPVPVVDRFLPWLRRRTGSGARWRWIVPLAVVVVLAAYYGIGAWMVQTIDANPDFAPGAVTARQSRVVALAAALIRRETETHCWTANDPIFLPGWILDDMPHFQEGIVAALARTGAGLAVTQVDGGVPGVGNDLAIAAGLLKYPGTVWKFDLSRSWAPVAPAEKQYRHAALAFEAYNRHLDQGLIPFDRRPEALVALLAVVAGDLGATSGVIEDHLGDSHWPINGTAAAIFYKTKGRLYAYSLLLREMGWDYADAIAARNLGHAWDQMLDTVRVAAGLDPLVVIDGAPDGALLPSHLAVQGFYLLRTRQDLSEIMGALKGQG